MNENENAARFESKHEARAQRREARRALRALTESLVASENANPTPRRPHPLARYPRLGSTRTVLDLLAEAVADRDRALEDKACEFIASTLANTYAGNPQALLHERLDLLRARFAVWLS